MVHRYLGHGIRYWAVWQFIKEGNFWWNEPNGRLLCDVTLPTLKKPCTIKTWVGGGDEAYSRLSTTHGHISPTASSIRWCMQIYSWWCNVDLSCLGRTIYTRQFLVPSHRFNSATGEQKGITWTIYTDPNLIGTRQRLHDAPALNIVLNGRGLPDLPQYDYLGLTIRCNLMWDVQINKLCSKLSQKVGLLFKLRHQVPSCMLMTVYSTMVQPILDYCITVCGYAPCTYIRKIERL